MNARTPLDVIQIERPCDCDMDWDALPGDGPVRVCVACRKEVHNLSSLPRHEAGRLVTDRAAVGRRQPVPADYPSRVGPPRLLERDRRRLLELTTN